MRLLLDTHALIWWLLGNERMPLHVRAAIDDERNETLVSAATAWEVTTRLGHLSDVATLAADFVGTIEREGFAELAITLDHAARAGALPGPHKDPFDRMLIAQAQAERLVLVSNETTFDRYGVSRLW